MNRSLQPAKTVAMRSMDPKDPQEHLRGSAERVKNSLKLQTLSVLTSMMQTSFDYSEKEHFHNHFRFHVLCLDINNRNDK